MRTIFGICSIHFIASAKWHTGMHERARSLLTGLCFCNQIAWFGF